MGVWAVLQMGVVSVACGSAALGLLRRERRGYWAALTILSIDLTGDIANAVIAHDWRTLIGLPIGGRNDCVSAHEPERILAMMAGPTFLHHSMCP
jgi:hypothetical protein